MTVGLDKSGYMRKALLTQLKRNGMGESPKLAARLEAEAHSQIRHLLMKTTPQLTNPKTNDT
jgi:hypothetical protein